MSQLQKIIYLTRQQYETLLSNNNTGQVTYGGITLTGVQDNNIYFITDETISASDLDNDFILPVSNGGTGKNSFTPNSIIGSGSSSTGAFVSISKANTITNDANTIPTTQAVYNDALLKSGGTMTGALNLANNTLNTAGDDSYYGDFNVAGHFCVKGKNGNTGIHFTTYNQSTNTTGGKITWDGTKFTITSTSPVVANISGNAGTATSLATGRTLKVNLSSTASSTAFTGTANITDIGVSGTLAIANGGTGLTSTTAHYVFSGPASGTGAPSWKLLTADDLPAHTHSYLPLSGGQMTGPLTWKDSTALPETTSGNYFLVIDAFASGGTTKWIGKANALTSLGALASTTKYAASNSVGGAANNAKTTANTSDSMYVVGVKSNATTTLLHDTAISIQKGKITIGSRETTTSPSEETSIDRIIITPYFHTGGPWKITSADDSSSAFLKLFYGSSELIKIKHDGIITLKKALPISEGGTGKTTASEAWTALGGGASGKHDDNYFALASHGNHVPATQTANNITFLRNDNSWYKLTSADVSTLINLLSTGDSALTANDYVITQYVGGGTTTTTYHRRKASNVVNATLVKAALGTNATHGNTYLRKDGTWQTPPYPVTSVNSKTGAVTLTAGDLNLSSALRFQGISSTTITDGSTSAAVISSVTLTATTGDVVLYGDGEYVWTGSAWEYLGGESSYKKVQSAVSDPTAGTTAVTNFIATISQNTEGVITATKRPLPVGTTSVTGIVKLGTAAAEAAQGNHTHSTTITKTGTSQINLDASTTYTLTAGGTTVVFKTPADTKNSAYGNISTAGAIAVSTSSTIATNDAFVISTTANSGKLTRSSIVFNTDNTTKVLSQAGTWIDGIGYGKIKSGAASTTATSISTNTATAESKSANEAITIQAGNKWIQTGVTNSSDAGSDVITLGHSVPDNAISNLSTTAQTPSFNSTFNIPTISLDEAGHVTGVGNTTVKIPALPSSVTPSSHKHGNINNDGTLGSTASYGVATDANKKIIAIDLTVSDPTASGNATTFVTSVTQSSQGKISVSRSTVPNASSTTAGIVKLGAEGGAATYSHTHSYLSSHGPSYGGIQVSAQSTTTTTLAGGTSAVTVTAAGANETVKFITKNKWIVVKGSNSSTSGSDEVQFAHVASVTAKTAYCSTSATASANGGKITVTDIQYDEAGHITSTTDRTITLSQTTYTLSSLGAASSTHVHGNISNTGTISTSAAPLNGDAIVISTSANNGLVKKTTITFDASTTTSYLNKKGEWGTPPNDKVQQIGSTTNKEYCALFKSTGDDTSSVTASVAFANGSGKLITGNFSTGRFSATSFRVNEQVTLEWNNTDSALEFVFA